MNSERRRSLWRDDSGQALTEYVLLAGFIVVLCIFLMDPDNGLYEGMRIVYDRISFLTLLPGP